MTDTTLAETILRDVPRYWQASNRSLQQATDGSWLKRTEVLAALTAAMDPAIAERAGEVLEAAAKAQEWMRYPDDAESISLTGLAEWVNRRPASVIPALVSVAQSLLARIAAMEAQIKGLEGGIEAACDREAETERKLRTALAASETRAEAAEAEVEKLRAERDALETERRRAVNEAETLRHYRKSHVDAEERLTAAEARITDLEAAIDSQDANEAGLWRFWSHKASELATKNAQLMQAGAKAEAERDALRAERDAAHALASERSSALLAAEATIATLTEKVEAMRRALKYYKDTFCEGFCGEDCWSDEGHSHPDLQRDCSGCLAASVLIRAARTTEASQ